ncbi:hypothetical protein FIU86_16055 [Roseovarius sp. THAF9]|nr:hypothetical protein FIU86_16055 [Roseovarius sp. THAF9]
MHRFENPAFEFLLLRVVGSDRWSVSSIVSILALILLIVLISAGQASSQDIADLKIRMTNAGCYDGKPPHDERQSLKFRTGVRCVQDMIGQDRTGNLTTEVINHLAGFSPEIPEEPALILGVTEQMIDRIRMEVEGSREVAPDFYTGPILSGVRAYNLLDRIYRGDFARIPSAQRGEVAAAYAALLLEYHTLVRRFGPTCVYPGDVQFKFTHTRSSRTAFGIATSDHYEQDLFAPQAHEKTARASFSSVGITPGLSILQDMMRIAKREGCRSPRMALLRENLHRYLAGIAPSNLDSMKARYPLPAPTAQASIGGGFPDDPRPFNNSCLLGQREVGGHPSALGAAIYCVCIERHLRAADLAGIDVVELYALLTSNWAVGYDRYRSQKLINTLMSTCNRYPYEGDLEEGRNLLRSRGIPLDMGPRGIR